VDADFARQYYESASAEHWWFKGRQRLVGELIQRFGSTGGKFLDLGAGAETLLPSSLSVVKLDLVTPGGVTGMFVQASAEALPFRSGTLDGVGLFDVLEHLDSPSSCLEEARRVVRPGGTVLITVPAYQWLWSPHDDLVQHKRRYTLASLEREIEGAGLSMRWASAFYGFLLLPALVRRLFSLQSPMSLPWSPVNRWLTRVAGRSAGSRTDRPSRIGLSLAAVASVD
jgi:SAM-dependent methyltransferase